MSFERIVISVSDISKRYEIYSTPRDRLRQMVRPRLHHLAQRVALVFGAKGSRPPPHYFREFWALRNVSFEVGRGETFGIIGRNGSGKSTLLQILAGTLSATSGQVRTEGRIAALLELGSGFDPEFTGRENVYLNCSILGMRREEVDNRIDSILAFADIGDFIDQPVKTFSSGMFVRLAFAVQAHIDASILIIDEALAVGDVFFRQKCHERMDRLRTSGTTIILVSHSMMEIEQFCERAILLERGSPIFTGKAAEATKRYYLLEQENKLHASNRASTTEIASVGAASTDFGELPEWPSHDAFLDISGIAQVSTGQATCTGVAMCNADGHPCAHFQQGDKVVFYFEFSIESDIGVPMCGLVIKNERGVIVHGKSSWQYETETPAVSRAGSRIRCRQEIELRVASGEYTCEIGMGAIDAADIGRLESISYEQYTSIERRICHLPDVATFTVALANRDGAARLTHHGVADLPGRITTVVSTPSSAQSGV